MPQLTHDVEGIINCGKRLAAPPLFSRAALREAWHGQPVRSLFALERACARTGAHGDHISPEVAAVTRMLNSGFTPEQIFDPVKWEGREDEALSLMRESLRDPWLEECKENIQTLESRHSPLRLWQQTLHPPKAAAHVR